MLSRRSFFPSHGRLRPHSCRAARSRCLAARQNQRAHRHDWSAVFGPIGMGCVEAARMAVEEFGGSVASMPIEVVFADNQSKPDIALRSRVNGSMRTGSISCSTSRTRLSQSPSKVWCKTKTKSALSPAPPVPTSPGNSAIKIRFTGDTIPICRAPRSPAS